VTGRRLLADAETARVGPHRAAAHLAIWATYAASGDVCPLDDAAKALVVGVRAVNCASVRLIQLAPVGV
jgi:hypothetical protein